MKKLKWITLGLVALVGLVSVVGGLVIKSRLDNLFTREAFVRQMETQWNCRADIGSLTVSLNSTPASIEIKNLVLAPRDADAENHTPLANRKPIPTGTGLVGAERAFLEINLGDLVRQRLHIKRLTLSGVNARNDVSEERGNLLGVLFDRPVTKAEAESVASASVSPPPSPPQPEAKAPVEADPDAASPAPANPPEAPSAIADAVPAKAKKHATFQAKELGLSVVIDEAKIERASFREVNHLVLSRTDVSDLNLTVKDVDVDPSDLSHHNQARMQLSAHIASKGRAKVGAATQNQDVKIADFTFEATSTVQPMDATTGEFTPTGTLDLKVQKGSTFGGVMTLGDLAGGDKGFSSMKKNFGIDVSDLVVGGAIQDDLQTKVAILGPRVEFVQEARLIFTEYTVTLRPGSWLNGAEDKTEMNLQLLPGEKLAKSILDGAAQKLGADLVSTASQLFNDDKGNLAFDFVATQRLTKPKVEMGGQVGELINAFKGISGGLLKGLVK